MRWRNCSGFVLILAAGLLLTGCFDVDVESTFEEDGSARHVYTATFEREALNEFGDLADEIDPETDFEESEETARELGYETERIDTDEHIGIRLSKTIEDNADLGQILNEIFTAAGEDPVTAFSGSYTRDGNVHRINIIVDGDDLFSEGMEEDESFSPAMLSSFITLTYTARLPGELRIEETNGRILPDGRVQWDIPLSGTETFVAVSETEGGSNLLLILGVLALLFLFIGGAVLLALFLFLRSRRAPATTPAPAEPAYQTGPDAPTAPLPPIQPEQEKRDDLNF